MSAWVPDLFYNFYLKENNKKMLKTQQPWKLEKNKHQFGIVKILELFKSIFDKTKKQSNFTYKKYSQICSDNQSIYLLISMFNER